ncbi:response regulator [Synechococcales cyanobacterium C]|uniref:Response regulator n=1 Tax=Petrachloros mirabilis ULC683 TaxID=2781853 RepID=A0A8K1ZYE0_9CYAN|nr:response regulator [Petrachloros mirabilis]NCJ06203.1 response regulator [Petrachloros mirabilis ULC683]
MRFLIIDDSSVDRHSLASLLTMLGHEVEQCDNTADALTHLESDRYDLVFLDVVMPEQDGYKFLRSLRLNPKTTNQYVVLYSGKKTPLEVNYGIKRAGADDYLVKPVTQENVTQVLERVAA